MFTCVLGRFDVADIKVWRKYSIFTRNHSQLFRIKNLLKIDGFFALDIQKVDDIRSDLSDYNDRIKD